MANSRFTKCGCPEGRCDTAVGLATFARPGTFLAGADPETGPVTERLRVREIGDDEGRRLMQIIRWAQGRGLPATLCAYWPTGRPQHRN